jgi:hypothetical protein
MALFAQGKRSGVYLILAALAMYYFGVHVPLVHMKAHAASVTYFEKLIIFIPPTVGLGVIQLLIGEGELASLGGKVILIMAMLFLFVLGLWWAVWLGKQADFYGYGHSVNREPTAEMSATSSPPNGAQLLRAEEEQVQPKKEPKFPFKGLQSLFDQAHKSGESKGVFVPSGHDHLPQSFNSYDVVEATVHMDASLVQPGCDRFTITLKQGGGFKHIRDGLDAMTPENKVAYSVNYCIDGSQPDGGFDMEKLGN